MVAAASILLCDDEPSFLESMSEHLRIDGYLCDVANDAYEAMGLLGTNRYDLLIADIKMPGNKNLELIARAQQTVPEMPVILVTGYPSTETAISSIHLPVIAYLKKPLSYETLRPHVEASLDSAGDFRAIGQVEEQLRTCIQQLNDLRRRRWAPESKAEPRRLRVPDGLLRSLAGCLAELAALNAARDPQAAASHTCELIGCPCLPRQRAILHKAITLLNATKRRFKSKELGQVRELLESLLESGEDS
jgi:DNA-binding response OmpR family regulator